MKHVGLTAGASTLVDLCWGAAYEHMSVVLLQPGEML